MHTCNITYDPFFNSSIPIMTDPNRKLGCHTEILQRAKLLLDYQLSRCQSVFFFRFDLRFPEGYSYPSDNSLLSSFLAYYIQCLKSKYAYLYPLYLWVREQSREKHQHYHIFFLVNGKVCQNEYAALSLAEHIWQLKLGLNPVEHSGLVDFCNKSRDGLYQVNGIKINKTDADFTLNYADAIYRISYLAKVNTKGYAPDHVKEYGSSLIPSPFLSLTI